MHGIESASLGAWGAGIVEMRKVFCMELEWAGREGFAFVWVAGITSKLILHLMRTETFLLGGSRGCVGVCEEGPGGGRGDGGRRGG